MVEFLILTLPPLSTRSYLLIIIFYQPLTSVNSTFSFLSFILFQVLPTHHSRHLWLILVHRPQGFIFNNLVPAFIQCMPLLSSQRNYILKTVSKCSASYILHHFTCQQVGRWDIKWDNGNGTDLGRKNEKVNLMINRMTCKILQGKEILGFYHMLVFTVKGMKCKSW